jgi:hypothetical protein
MKTAYMKIYAYNEKGECTDIEIIEIIDGKITMRSDLGQPVPEKTSKEKPTYGRE